MAKVDDQPSHICSVRILPGFLSALFSRFTTCSFHWLLTILLMASVEGRLLYKVIMQKLPSLLVNANCTLDGNSLW